MNKLNTNPQHLACHLDYNLTTLLPIRYEVKSDSIFFKKKAWDSYTFDNLYFACKVYNDSIVARITPMDYFDTLSTKTNLPNKFYIATYKFIKADCDTNYLKKMQTSMKK